mgnify:CR=1 FL=1
MHIVHIYDGHEKVFNGRGSVPGVVWNVARESAAAGTDVTVIERKWDGLSSAVEHEGVQFKRLTLATGPDEPWTRVPYQTVNSPLGLGRLVADRTNFAIQTLRTLRHIDFDVLHVHLPFAANVLVTVAPWLRDRVVYTAHLGELRLNALEETGPRDGSGSMETEAGKGGYGVAGPESDGTGDLTIPSVVRYLSPDYYLVQRAAQTTVLNPEIRDAFVELGASPATITAIPNGVDIDRFRSLPSDATAEVRNRYDLADTRLVLFVGTVMPRKGVVELVRAMATAVTHTNDNRDVKLLIVGEADLDPAYTDRVQRTIRDAGMQSHVEITGFVSEADLRALYALADVFVLPSREEGFGMTVVEAMAAGTPIVATRVGSVPNVVEPGQHGFVVAPGNIAELADGIERLLENTEARNHMGDRARQRAEAYSWRSITNEFTSIYERVA